MAARKLQLGAEPRKVAILVCLLAVAGYLFYVNVFSEPDVPRRAQRPAASSGGGASLAEAVSSMTGATAQPPRTAPPAARAARAEFRPSLKPRQGEVREMAAVDPTLRVDLLERLASVSVDRVERSLFDFTTAPPKPVETSKQPEPVIVPRAKLIGPLPPPPPKPPPVKPPPPPINLKFYGSVVPVQGGIKRVFCIEGDEIFTPAEGDVLKRRYRIVRINPSSVLVEDMDHKHQQTLPIEEVPKTG